MPIVNLKDHFSFGDILVAYLDCRKRKRTKSVAIAFEVNLERNLMQLLEEVNDGTYQIGRTRVFAVNWPKPREVWAAQFRDRVVHHLVYNEIGPYFEKRFIEDSFSCIKGRGTLAASTRLEGFCRSITENWQKPAWVLQVDIANFFVSISREILWELLKKEVGEDTLTAKLIKQIVFNDPTHQALIKKGSDFSQIPKHKSLWNCKPGYGLPIGNLTSQFMSNIYLDGLDKYIKHTLKVRHYTRYVDDAVLLSKDRSFLYEAKDAIDTWLRENRELHLHPNKVRIAPVHQGVDFVGKHILPFRSYPRRMTVASAKRVLEKLRKNHLDRKAFESLQSYIGILTTTKTYRLREHLCKEASLPLFIGHDSKMTKLIKTSN